MAVSAGWAYDHGRLVAQSHAFSMTVVISDVEVQHNAASTCRFRNEHSEVSKCEKGDHVVFSPSSNHAFETTDSTVFVRPELRRSASLQYSDEAWKSMLRPLSQLSSTAGTAALDQQCHSPIQVLPPSQGKPQWLHRSLFMLGQSHSLPSRSNIKPWHIRPTNDKRHMFAT